MADSAWLADDEPTIADISACGYIFLAAEAEIDLKAWCHVLEWSDRLAMLPGWHHPGKLPLNNATVAPTVVVPEVDED